MLSFTRAINDITVHLHPAKIEKGIRRICLNYAENSFWNRHFYSQSRAAAINILKYIDQLQNQVSLSQITDEQAAHLLFRRIFALGKSETNPHGLDPYGFVCRGIWVDLADVMLRELDSYGHNYSPIQDDFRSFIEPINPYHAYSNPISQGLCDAVREVQQILYIQMRTALNLLAPAVAAANIPPSTEETSLVVVPPNGETQYLRPE